MTPIMSLFRQKTQKKAFEAVAEETEIMNISEKLSIKPFAKMIAPVTGKQKYVNPAINIKNK